MMQYKLNFDKKINPNLLKNANLTVDNYNAKE
jgi:hypothetical protein